MVCLIEEQLYEIKDGFDKIAAAKGKAKEGVVVALFKEPNYAPNALRLLLDPAVVFHIGDKSFQEVFPLSACSRHIFEDFFELCQWMQDKKALTNADVATVEWTLAQIEDNDLRAYAQDFLCKKITLGVTAKTVNKALDYEFIPEFRCMLANKYFEHPDKVEGKHFYLTEKLDGCFTGDTKVLMADGTEKRIDEIRLGDFVMSFNEETKEISPQRVMNVFHNGIKPISEWTRIYCDKRVHYINQTKVNATKNHRFFTDQGWVSAEDVNGDMNAYIYDYIPSKSQISFLVGSALGDTAAIFDNRLKRKHVRFCVAHKNDKVNAEYMNMICCLFANHASPIRHRMSGYGTDMILTNIGVIDALPNCFHDQSNYIRTSINPTKDDLTNLIDPLAIAVWYIDDGSMRRGREDGANDSTKNVTSRASIATNRYEKEMVERLTDILSQRFGIECSCVRDKKRKDGKYGYRIDFNKHGAEKLFELITPYIPSCMRYKIPFKYHHIKEIRWWEDTGKNGMRLIDVRQDEMKKTYKNKNGVFKRRTCFESYDIEVENNHTYFANGFAVHNCRAIAIVKDNGVQMFSRQGVPIEGLVDVNKWLLFIRDHVGKDFVFDGELLVSDRENIPSKEQYKRTTMIVRREGEKSGITYNVFDVLDVEAFETRSCDTAYYLRRQKLESYFACIKSPCEVALLPVLYHGSDTSEIIRHLNEQRKLQHEGVMVNLADETYQFTRTNALLKVKVMQDCDLEVIGFEAGKGKFEGTLGALIVDYKGTPVGVGSGLSDGDRRMFWNHQDEYLGRVATIQYFEETHAADGKPSIRFPVFKELREAGKEVSYS